MKVLPNTLADNRTDEIGDGIYRWVMGRNKPLAVNLTEPCAPRQASMPVRHCFRFMKNLPSHSGAVVCVAQPFHREAGILIFAKSAPIVVTFMINAPLLVGIITARV